MNVFNEGLARYLDEASLSKIRSATIGIAGAGGLGSNAAASLVRSGFVKFVIADFDRVEPSNLNRQFFFANQVGRQKVEALKENLSAINPEIQIDTHAIRVTAGNAKGLFGHCDAIIEAFDTVESKQMIAETIVPEKIFFVCASGIAGYGYTDEIRVRKINDRFFCVGDFVREIGRDHPPLAPRVAIAAAKQADLVLEYVVNGCICMNDVSRG